MSPDRRSYFPFWKGKFLGNLLCWNMKLFHPFNSLLLSYIAHLYIIMSYACCNPSFVLIHCNHLLSHQFNWWKLQVKLQYVFTDFCIQAKPSNECWKTTATYFIGKQRKLQALNTQRENWPLQYRIPDVHFIGQLQKVYRIFCLYIQTDASLL